MSLQTRLADLISAIGADIKAIPYVRQGRGAPTNSIGKVGDYYLDMATGDLYGPKAVRAPAKVTGLAGQLQPNPSLETDITGWSVSGVAAGGGVNISERTQDRAQDGSWSYHGKVHRINSAAVTMLAATVGTGLSAIPVSPSTAYSFALRVYLRLLQNYTGIPGLLRLTWYKSDGTASSVSTSTLLSSGLAIAPVFGEWTEHNFENVVSPSDAGFCRPTIQFGNTVLGVESIGEFDIDSVVVVAGSEIPKWGVPIGNIDLGSRVTSIETELGSSPKGSAASVAARFTGQKRVVDFSGVTSVDLDSLNPTVTKGIRLTLHGSSDGNSIDAAKTLLLPNKSSSNIDYDETFVDGSANSTNVAGALTELHEAFNTIDAFFLCRAIGSDEQVFMSEITLPLVGDNLDAFAYSGRYSSRRTGSVGWYHVGGMIHGFLHTPIDISSARITFPVPSTGFVVIESLSGYGL